MNASTNDAEAGGWSRPAPGVAMPPCAFDAIVIGASMGGIDALGMLLPALPADLPCAVAVVVHIPGDRDSLLVDIFQDRCALPVSEASLREPIEPGRVYFAAPDYHLLVETDRTWAISRDAPVNWSRPSIDVLFETAAWSYGRRLLGILLTGANDDGARGLLEIARAGGTTWVQDPDTALAAAMPQAAIDLGGAGHVFSLSHMARKLTQLRGPSARTGRAVTRKPS